MANEKLLKPASSVYQTVCKALELREWSFKRDDEKLMISCGVRGDDIPMDLYIEVNPNAQVVSLYSPLPFRVEEDKRVDMAVVISMANYGFTYGAFDYDISEGYIQFRMTSSFFESIISDALINQMISVAIGTVDDYNDRFLMVSKGMLSVQQFAELEAKRGS